ncbi:MAG: dipeptidase [Candidatus Binatia bacterium]|nr:MAG: dipeptidase [Candidatus Binatia bacterium]
MRVRPRVACDSLVALGRATADGSTLFAKNSDRPATEAQPLSFVPRERHEAGAKLRCQYIEIEQVPETAAVLGSRPYWLWGFEHGVNEHRVAIGNHTVFTKETLEGYGLLGMDLVRLGLERGKTAAEAVEVLVSLLERYGQGGSGYVDKDWPYHNSFLVADPHEGYLLETSGRHWALRRIDETGSASNHLTVGSDWTRIGEDTEEFARRSGWLVTGPDGRFDFAASYRDKSLVPEQVSSGRYRRTCAFLGEGRGKLSARDLRRILRDHYEDGVLFRPRHTPEDERYFSVCMHAEPVGTTTASLVARLPDAPDEVVSAWVSLGSPCVGIFVPFYLEAGVPEAWQKGGPSFERGSAWWTFHEILEQVEKDWEGRAPRVRAFWDEEEEKLALGAEKAEREARELRRSGKEAEAARVLREFSWNAAERVLSLADRLLAELGAGG